LLGRDQALLQRVEAVLDADVVEREPGEAAARLLLGVDQTLGDRGP
jgi:hypothetical protein